MVVTTNILNNSVIVGNFTKKVNHLGFIYATQLARQTDIFQIATIIANYCCAVTSSNQMMLITRARKKLFFKPVEFLKFLSFLLLLILLQIFVKMRSMLLMKRGSHVRSDQYTNEESIVC